MNELQKLYDLLSREGYYTKSFDEFKSKYNSDSEYRDKVYGVVNRDGFYTKTKDEFLTKYSPVQTELKKKDTVVDGTSPMEPMDSTLPQAEADTLSESEELTGYENLKLFKEDEESEASKKLKIGFENLKESVGRIPLFIAEQAVTTFADDEELAYLNSLPVEQREKAISSAFSGLGRITGSGFALTNEATEFSNEARKRREDIESTLKQYETSIGEDFANLDVKQATTRVFNEVVGTIPQLAQAMIPYVGLASLGLGSAAQKSGELQREGEDLGLRTSANAIVSGTAEAAFELVTRKLGNKLLKSFKVNPDEAIQSFGNSLKETFIDANLEGGSELATTITQNLSDALIQGRDVDVNNVIREAIDAYIIGSAMGGTLTGSGKAVRTTKQVAEKNRLANQIKDTKYNTIEEVFEPSPKFPEGDLGVAQTEIDKETLDLVSNPASRKFLAEGLRRQVRKGDITQEDADARLRDFDRIKKSNERVNQDAPEDLRPQIVEKLREQEVLSEEIEGLNQLESTTGQPQKENIQEKKDRIEEINQEINAIQEQETGDIPDAERAEGVQEVEEEVREPDVEEAEEEIIVEPKTIEQLEEENKSTFPKIPTGKVFLNEPSQPSPEARKRADDVIEAGTEADLESETISVKDIIPTQKNLTESNLRETADVSTTEEPIIATEQEGKFYVIDGHHRLANTILSGNQSAEVKVVKEPVVEETESQKIELESIKEGSIITKTPIKIFKGIGGKKDLSGQRISAHEGVKGVFSSIDKTLAEEYSRGEGIAEATIPSGTTVEVVEVELKGSPREFREKEVEAINNSDAQIVKLITIDGRLRPGERRQSQYIIKDTNLIESLQEVKVDQTLTEESLPGYGRMVNRIDDIIQRMSKKPDMTNEKILDSVTKNLQSRDPAYRRATDVQREQIIRDLRSRLGVKEKAAPSAKRVTGQPKRKKVTVDEYASLKSQIRLEAKAAREAVTSYKNAGKKIAEAVKALGGKGKITLRQANTVAKKILRTNFTNTKQVNALLDYVEKIYERAELAEMVSNARSRIKQAKKNLASKVGTNTALKSVVQDVLSLDPTDVPLNLLPEYVALVQSFGERKAVLNLPEQGVVMQTANAILDSIQDSFDATTRERVEDADYDLDQSVKEITEDKIDTKNILNPDVKKLAEKLNSLTKKDIEGLVTENKDGVKNYAKVENLRSVKREMSKGYAPKMANDLMLEIESQRGLDSLENEGAIANVQNRGIMVIGRTIASIKSLITGKGITQEQLRAIPFIGTSLDNVLGNLNQTQFREKIIDPVANSFSMMTDKLQDIRNEYLQTAEYLLSNDGFVKRSRNSILKSKYKVQLYLLQKENLSNLGSNQVAPAIEFLNETIKYLSKDTSARRNMSKEILEELREEFAPNDGPLDFEKLENSLSKNEIQAATLINQAYNETSSMYEFVSSVVRGEGLKPLNNYVHHSVLKDLEEQKKDNDLTVERMTKPSTKSKTIIERTPGAKAINFDPISSADRGIKMMLTDYYMTNPIREVRSLINKLKSTPDLTKFQKNAFEDLDKVFEESIQIVFGKSLESITGANNFFNAVEELGYYAALASVPRAAAELGSNLAGAVIMNPRTFSLGVTNFGELSLDSTSVAKFAAAIGSKSRSKLAPKGIGGKLQQELTNYNVTSRNKGALNPILDKANFIAKNTTGRIGDATANVAQKLLSTPDMAISRPMYFQTFVNEFQNITGEKLTSDDLKAIANGDTKILEQYPDAVSKARDVADTSVERLSGTTNPFKQPLKYQLKVGDDIFAKAYKKANKYMASFYSVENNTATEGVVALFYSGEITRRQATALLAMITTRMSVYMSLYAMLQTLFDELISNALGLRQEEEEDEDYGLLTARQAIGSISTLILRRNLGSVSSIPIMYGIEKVNEEYLEALRGGDEYDKFKNGMVYVPIREGKSPIEQGVSMLSGAKGPAINTISRLATVYKGMYGSEEQETRDQYKEELNTRMAIEVLGNVGLLPFYKDVRRIIIEDLFSERENQKAIRKLQKQIEKEEERYYREQKKKREKFGK